MIIIVINNQKAPTEIRQLFQTFVNIMQYVVVVVHPLIIQQNLFEIVPTLKFIVKTFQVIS